jgi:pimeloyl-ACP methyl ester carboxylesterase
MPDFVSHFVRTQDGLNLHVRDYGRRSDVRLPVVCLHGLARTGADFHHLAIALSDDSAGPRQVIAMDYRGRGRSDYDPNAANYNVGVELNDLLAVLTALGIGRAIFIGTSRGGILTMLLAAACPDLLAGAVLNDIGPVIEPGGLMRIKGYVGRLSQPASFEEGGEMLRRLFGAQFTALTPQDWIAFAQRTFEERYGRLVACYDPALAQTLAGSTPMSRRRRSGRSLMLWRRCRCSWCAAKTPTCCPGKPSRPCCNAGRTCKCWKWPPKAIRRF